MTSMATSDEEYQLNLVNRLATEAGVALLAAHKLKHHTYRDYDFDKAVVLNNILIEALAKAKTKLEASRGPK